MKRRSFNTNRGTGGVSKAGGGEATGAGGNIIAGRGHGKGKASGRGTSKPDDIADGEGQAKRIIQSYEVKKL